MPQVCGHFVVAEKVREALNNPGYLEHNQEALNLGAIGPDLFLLLFDINPSIFDLEELDIAGSDIFDSFQNFLNKIISFYDTIHFARDIFNEVSNKLTGPIEDLAEWIVGQLCIQLLDIVRLSSFNLLEAFKMNLIPETGPVQIRNPFAGLNIRGVSNDEMLKIEASDLSILLRRLGHPYSKDNGYKKCAEANTYKDWWWMDILHYRKTVPFARALLDNCGSDSLLKAYSIGYFSHVGADICGHPYTNGLVGGPFRTHVIRHMLLENISDTWIWKYYHNKDVSIARLDRLIELPDSKVEKIVKYLIKQLELVYPSKIFNSKDKPNVDRLCRAYTTMKHFLRMSTDSGIEPPTPPPSGFAEYLEEIGRSIAGTAQNVVNQFDSDNEWWEWLLAPFLAAAYAGVLLFKIATIPAVLIRNLSESSLRCLAYDIQRGLWEYIVNARWQLSLSGWGKPSSLDLCRQFAKTGYQIPSSRTGERTFNYPYKQVPRDSHGFWLKDPSDIASLDDMKAECCPYPKGATPNIYIDGPGYNIEQDAKLKGFSQRSLTIDDTISIEHETYNRSQFGNAVEFTLKLMNDEYRNAGFDLDGDHGYGFLCWKKGDNGVPEYDNNLIF